MAKWRTEVDICFNSESDAVAFLNLLQDIKDKLFAGTGKEVVPIISKCRYHECFHDEAPPKPCGNYVNIDLKRKDREDIRTGAGVKVDAAELLNKGEVA